MKNYQDSDYALNKYSEGIVYRFADGIVEYTLADYLAENPGKTEADFRELKAFSDANYLASDRSDCRQTRNNVSIHSMEDSDAFGGETPEEEVIERPEREAEESKRLALAREALDRLTEVQRRRYLLYTAHGLTTRQIAEKEGASQRTIMDSIQWAEKKIKKFLEKQKNNLSKHRFFDVG